MSQKYINISFIVILIILSVTIGAMYVFVNDSDQPTNEYVEKSIGCSISINCNSESNSSIGTGFVVKQNNECLVVTNAHVVTFQSSGSTLIHSTILCSFSDSDECFPLSVKDYSLDLDIALLVFDDYVIIKSTGEFGDSKKLNYGSEVYTIGNAMGLGLAFTKGYVSVPLVRDISSGIDRYFIQTDLAVNKGNSGGPLFDTNGNIVGMVSMKYNGSMSSVEGISFSIPSYVIVEYIERNI